MSIVTKKDKLKTLEQENVYGDISRTIRILQGDAHSDRIYKSLYVIKNISQDLCMIHYVHAKYDGEYLRETNIVKVFKSEGIVERREHANMVWDNQEEIRSYDDSRGNHWKREWGVKMPYDIQSLTTLRKKDTTVGILDAPHYSGLRVTRYCGDVFVTTRPYMEQSLWLEIRG
jgi:hypothetical protein